jgi:TolB-like protein/class 3 adenylate cyclase/Flp pilus assembly protein TadD
MAAGDVKRKLTAIFSADVEGYSRLMGEDEESTVRTLTAYREIMSSLIQQYRGRVVDSPGDNLLAEFSSVVDAVQCGVEIQQVLKARNAGLPESRRMEFRIGVNLGDVIEEGERIYGDGVNIAARVEGLAEKGSICISGSAYEQIKNKLALGYEYLGEHQVKNIVEPVRVYKAQIEPVAKKKGRKAGLRGWQWAAVAAVAILVLGVAAFWNFYLRPQPSTEEVASLEKMALPLPDKPSIAVLPFVNMSEDPKQEYFSDGITEDLITDLSQISGLFIIARNSTFAYKGKVVKIKQVAEELGVRYVLEGSVRRADKQVRINVQLIDATTGHHLWAKRYDGKMDDVFALQDKITQKIVAALAVKLTSGEKEKVTRKETENIAAYDAFLKGWGYYQRHTPKDFAKALSYFEKATELDPNYSRAYASMALIYSIASKHGTIWLDALYAYPMTANRRAKKNLEMAMKNPTSAAYRAASFIKVYDRQYEAATSDAERALSLDPNDSASLENMAFVLIMAGKPEEGLGLANKAMRFDPLNLANPLYNIGLAHFCLKEFEQAANSLERALTYSPGHVAYLIALAAAYGNLSREKEAEATVELLIKTITRASEGFKREDYFSPYDVYERIIIGWAGCRYPPFKEHEMTDLLEGGLTKAGLKEIANFRAALTTY